MLQNKLQVFLPIYFCYLAIQDSLSKASTLAALWSYLLSPFSFLLFINSSCGLRRDRASLQELLRIPYEQSRRNENGHLVIETTFYGMTKAFLLISP